MTNSDSDSSFTYDSDDSEFNFLPGYVPGYELEIEGEQDASTSTSKELTEVEYSDSFVPYADEPIADQEWLDDYDRQQDLQKEFKQKLQSRCDEQDVSSWCQCGNCQIDHLQNPNEYQCCVEIEECVESLSSESVMEESSEIPKCTTLHPGFEQVCLSKWSLRLAADKYKRKDKATYRQTGSEEEFLRSIAYREFTPLVHGYLGGRRIPLPACAYHRIREKFSDTNYKGFEVEDHDDGDDV